jgi:hypothetical protein
MKNLLYSCLFLVLASGCISVPANEQITTSSINTLVNSSPVNGCIQPVTTFAYPLDGVNKALSNIETAPPKPWKTQANIFDLPAIKALPDAQHYINVQFTRKTENYLEVWVMDSWADQKKHIRGHSIYVYRTNNNTWKEVPSIIAKPQSEIYSLYLGSEGEVWAIASPEIGNVFGYYLGLSTNTARVFAVFNEKDNRFDSLKITQKIPIGGVSFDSDKFWIFEENGSIYDLDLKTLKTTKYLDPRNTNLAKYNASFPENLIQYDNALAFKKDGSFYFVDGTPREPDLYTRLDTRIYHFVPQKNVLEIIENPLQGEPTLLHLFVDSADNLWVSDYGWMDEKGIWYQIVRSPVFITDKLEGSFLYWETPKIVLQSSSKSLWFQSANGMVSLDPQKGEWCWFTTYQSNIVEDSDHNLWMIADGKLYKNPLGK